MVSYPDAGAAAALYYGLVYGRGSAEHADGLPCLVSLPYGTGLCGLRLSLLHLRCRWFVATRASLRIACWLLNILRSCIRCNLVGFLQHLFHRPLPALLATSSSDSGSNGSLYPSSPHRYCAVGHGDLLSVKFVRFLLPAPAGMPCWFVLDGLVWFFALRMQQD